MVTSLICVFPIFWPFHLLSFHSFLPTFCNARPWNFCLLSFVYLQEPRIKYKHLMPSNCPLQSWLLFFEVLTSVERRGKPLLHLCIHLSPKQQKNHKTIPQRSFGSVFRQRKVRGLSHMLQELQSSLSELLKRKCSSRTKETWKQSILSSTWLSYVCMI